MGKKYEKMQIILLPVVPALTNYLTSSVHYLLISAFSNLFVYLSIYISILSFYLTLFLANKSLAFCLAPILRFYLAFCLACGLTFFLPFFLASMLTFYLPFLSRIFLAFYLAFLSGILLKCPDWAGAPYRLQVGAYPDCPGACDIFRGLCVCPGCRGVRWFHSLKLALVVRSVRSGSLGTHSDDKLAEAEGGRNKRKKTKKKAEEEGGRRSFVLSLCSDSPPNFQDDYVPVVEGEPLCCRVLEATLCSSCLFIYLGKVSSQLVGDNT